MTVGKILWFNHAIGVGAIAPHDGTRQAFFHISSVAEAGLVLRIGQSLRYDVRQEAGKLAAINLAAI